MSWRAMLTPAPSIGCEVCATPFEVQFHAVAGDLRDDMVPAMRHVDVGREGVVAAAATRGPAIEEPDGGRREQDPSIRRRQFHEREMMRRVPRRDQARQRGVTDPLRKEPELDRVAGRPLGLPESVHREALIRLPGPEHRATVPARVPGDPDRAGHEQGWLSVELVGDRVPRGGLEPPVASRTRTEDRIAITRPEGKRREGRSERRHE